MLSVGARFPQGQLIEGRRIGEPGRKDLVDPLGLVGHGVDRRAGDGRDRQYMALEVVTPFHGLKHRNFISILEI